MRVTNAREGKSSTPYFFLPLVLTLSKIVDTGDATYMPHGITTYVSERVTFLTRKFDIGNATKSHSHGLEFLGCIVFDGKKIRYFAFPANSIDAG